MAAPLSPTGANAPPPLTGLPDALAREALTTGSGEALWPEDVVLAVLDWVLDCGLVLHGGEVYARRGPARTVFVSDWTTSPHAAGTVPAAVESAVLQGRRAVVEALRTLPPDLRDPVCFLAVGVPLRPAAT